LIGWAIVTLFFTLDGVVTALGSYRSRATFGDDLARQVVAGWLWVPYTMAAVELTYLVPVERGRIARALAAHAVVAALVVVTRPVLTIATDPWLHWQTPLPGYPRLVLNGVRFNIFLYILIAGAAHAVYFALRARDGQRHAERLEAQLTGARLDALRAQLQPHFLFNALGGIAELVHRDPHAADRMLVRLSRLLRTALDDRTEHVVTLAHELACLEPYLELERMRYGDRLTVIEDIEPAARGARVPVLLLQPLVENAIRHGIAPRPAPGTVTIRARLAGDAVRLEIEDDGVGLAPGFTTGIGLRNTRARLAELYGDASELALGAGPAAGTVVRISVPRERTAP
jgi:two-component system, LytTR family, sensor kinase